MNLNDIVAQIDAEISKLTQAKQALLGVATKKGPGRPRGTIVSTTSPVSALKPKRHKMSAAGRARIAAAQKARWAKVKKVAKPVAAKPAAVKAAAKK
jgi:hypothetical protein